MSEDKTFNVSDTARFASDIYNKLTESITTMRPVSGRAYIECKIRMKDDHFFGDSEILDARVVIDVNLDDGTIENNPINNNQYSTEEIMRGDHRREIVERYRSEY